MTSFPLRQRQAVGVSSLPLQLPYWEEGKPPVQCSNLDLCIFLDRKPFIHTSCTHTVAGVLTLRRPSSRRLFHLFLWNCHTGSRGNPQSSVATSISASFSIASHSFTYDTFTLLQGS